MKLKITIGSLSLVRCYYYYYCNYPYKLAPQQPCPNPHPSPLEKIQSKNWCV